MALQAQAIETRQEGRPQTAACSLRHWFCCSGPSSYSWDDTPSRASSPPSRIGAGHPGLAAVAGDTVYPWRDLLLCGRAAPLPPLAHVPFCAELEPGFLAAFAFLVWITSGTSMNLPGMFQATLLAATPLTLGAMAGIFCERSGIINIAIEGMMLAGAFAAVAFASLFGSLWMGLLAASLMGGLMAALHAVLSIKYKVDQIISGTVINILAAGATRFLNVRLLQPAGLRTTGLLWPVAHPGAGRDPDRRARSFSRTSPSCSSCSSCCPGELSSIFATPWGLRMRACGEHPRAADTVGVHVNRMRYISVIIGGLIAGIGGAYFSLGVVGTFEDGMTRGQGFVALAAMIFGNWNPIGAFLAALLFGFADALQVKMQIIQPILPFINQPIPPEFLQIGALHPDDHRRGRGRRPIESAGRRGQTVREAMSAPAVRSRGRGGAIPPLCL
jgi:ABC-type uncharacterized transport system permease subunit